jgi:DNA-binding transcriptional LysR family regulator
MTFPELRESFLTRAPSRARPHSIASTSMRDLSALTIFVKVVEAQSFSGAAKRLKMPLSTVSRRIAELEVELGVRLLERSTRSLRLTDIGTEVLEHARHGAELCEAVDSLVSNSLSDVSGTLHLCAPPSISDSLIVPVVKAFQASYPNVRVRVRITERISQGMEEDVDIAFKVGPVADPEVVARRLLTYRHQVVASAIYLSEHPAPRSPKDLLAHCLLAFSFWRPEYRWAFRHAEGQHRETIEFDPCIAMNDYAALARALVSGAGIGELPPIVRPELMRTGRLVEVMPDWRLPLLDLSIVHAKGRHMPRQVRVFREFATQMVPRLFPLLPV